MRVIGEDHFMELESCGGLGEKFKDKAFKLKEYNYF